MSRTEIVKRIHELEAELYVLEHNYCVGTPEAAWHYEEIDRLKKMIKDSEESFESKIESLHDYINNI